MDDVRAPSQTPQPGDGGGIAGAGPGADLERLPPRPAQIDSVDHGSRRLDDDIVAGLHQ